MAKPVGSRRGLADQLVILCVRPDPYPVDPLRDVRSQGAIMITNTNRPQGTDALEVKRRVTWVRLEKSIVLVGQLSDVRRQRVVQSPESRRREVPQKLWAFPAL